MHESYYYKHKCFVTLTYSPENLPENGVLVKRDLQNYIKRLRKDCDYKGIKIKYYACGEYGEKNGRPHYHMIMLGLSRFDRDLIESNWSKGLVDIGTVTYQSIRYVVDYFNKDDRREKYPEGILPFKLQSNGLGKRYVEDYSLQLLSEKSVFVNGVKRALPRYYLNKLLISEKELEMDRIKRTSETLEEYEKKYEKSIIGLKMRESRNQKERNVIARSNLKMKGKM